MQREAEKKPKKHDEEKKTVQSDALTTELSDVPTEEACLTQEEAVELPIEKEVGKDKVEQKETKQEEQIERAAEEVSTEQPIRSKEEKEEKEAKFSAFYYWPILPQEHYKRWQIENATM